MSEDTTQERKNRLHEPITVQQAAAELGLSSDVVRRRIAAGKLQAVLHGSQYEIDRESLFRFKRQLEINRQPISPDDIPLRPEEVAARLGVSVGTALRLMHEGELQHFKPGANMYRCLPIWLDEFVRSHTTAEGWPREPNLRGHLLSVPQAAEAHNKRTRYPMTVSQMRNWCKIGMIRYVKIGRSYRLFPETVQGLLSGFAGEFDREETAK